MAAETRGGDGSPGALAPGAIVRLRGLQRSEYNHHVGRVVKPLGEEGRVGVALHGAIWSKGGGRRDYSKYDAKLLRPENLRPLRLPLPNYFTSTLGSIPVEAIIGSLNDGGRVLPENVVEAIAEFLRVYRVASDDIRVAGCSSSRGDFPLQAALNDLENEWWISAAGTMPNGSGSEYLEFSFSRRRMVTFVAIKIPSLPHGPLSVRHFHLLARRDDDSTWVAASEETLETLDRNDLQEFALVPPVEARAVRLVCTRNAAAASHPSLLRADCIGLFQVAFA
mmetsp:Transcript_40112/g.120051  ORF Transcript_40112/g.120051 Transcript_40112/m.120051 type:complete len:280 (+) Transcript_40112:17-856(+)